MMNRCCSLLVFTRFNALRCSFLASVSLRSASAATAASASSTALTRASCCFSRRFTAPRSCRTRALDTSRNRVVVAACASWAARRKSRSSNSSASAASFSASAWYMTARSTSMASRCFRMRSASVSSCCATSRSFRVFCAVSSDVDASMLSACSTSCCSLACRSSSAPRAFSMLAAASLATCGGRGEFSARAGLEEQCAARGSKTHPLLVHKRLLCGRVPL